MIWFCNQCEALYEAEHLDSERCPVHHCEVKECSDHKELSTENGDDLP